MAANIPDFRRTTPAPSVPNLCPHGLALLAAVGSETVERPSDHIRATRHPYTYARLHTAQLPHSAGSCSADVLPAAAAAAASLAVRGSGCDTRRDAAAEAEAGAWVGWRRGRPVERREGSSKERGPCGSFGGRTGGGRDDVAYRSTGSAARLPRSRTASSHAAGQHCMVCHRRVPKTRAVSQLRVNPPAAAYSPSSSLAVATTSASSASSSRLAANSALRESRASSSLQTGPRAADAACQPSPPLSSHPWSSGRCAAARSASTSAAKRRSWYTYVLSPLPYRRHT